MNIPADLRYTKEHEWIRLDDDGTTATVGITDFAQHELGDIVYVDIQEEGEDLDADDVFGSVEAVKTVSELFMPVAGKIVEVNEAIDGNPEVINQDPYGEGWMVKIELADGASLEDLLTPEAYADVVAE